MGQTLSGVGVLDKSVAVLGAVADAGGAASLAGLVASTGFSRATTHRLAVALEVHDLLRRDSEGRFALGGRLVALGHRAAGGWPVAEASRPALEALRNETGESVQLYVRDGDHRRCLVSLESPHELRTIVAEGARLPLGVGSAGRVLLGELGPGGWLASQGERAPGVGSVSAPVQMDGQLVAAVGISGPLARLGPGPGERFGAAVARAGVEVTERLASAQELGSGPG